MYKLHTHTHTHTHNRRRNSRLIIRNLFLMSFAFVFMLASCSKESIDENEINDEIISLRSDGSMDAWINAAEEIINRNYGDPSGYHDAYDQVQTELIVNINEDGTIDESKNDYATEILGIISCDFHCSSLPNKAPLYFDIQLQEADNGDGTASLTISTGIGNQLIGGTQGPPLKEFLQGDEYNALGAPECGMDGLDPTEGAAPKLGNYVTFNQWVENGPIPLGTYFTNISDYFYIGSDFPGPNGQFGGNFGWDDGIPQDLVSDFNTFKFWCDQPGYPNCNTFFDGLGTPNIAFWELTCLEYQELNDYLTDLIGVTDTCAEFFEKEFLNLDANSQLSFSGKRFWSGNQRNGERRSREIQLMELQNPNNDCECN